MFKRIQWALATGLALGAVAAPAPAHACGCFSPPDPSVPIVQAGERILFFHTEGKVTAHIQIQYQGDAAEFGWILPLPAVPDMKLGTQELFDQLIDKTQPQYILQTVVDESCNEDNDGRDSGAGPSSGAGGAGGAGAGGEGPLVLRDQIGPYDYAVLRADNREEMFNWLAENRFFVPTGTENAAGPYIREGAYFLALKLRGGQGTGDLQPVVVEYASDRAMIPIILTSVAANPNMGVQVWVLGDDRAIPVNYRHTVLNEALLDWANRAQNYLDVLTRAVNEAAEGQSFITEYAGASTIMRDVIDYQGRFGDLAELQRLGRASEYARYLEQNGYAPLPTRQNSQGGPGGPGGPGFGRLGFDSVLRGILARGVPMPEAVRQRGIPEDEFYGRLGYYLNEYRTYNAEDFIGWQDVIDAPVVTAEINEKVVMPTLAAGAAFRTRDYLSRLFTFLDPQEMTKDPVFDFNADLPEVPNVHTATMTVSCLRQGGTIRQARVLRLENGRRLFFRPEEPSNVWTNVTMPQSQRIELLPLEGPPAIEIDNTTAIDLIIEERNRSIAGEYDGWDWGSMGPTGGAGGAGGTGGGQPSDPVRPKSSGCAMDAGSASGAPALLALLGLGLVALRSRRRSR